MSGFWKSFVPAFYTKIYHQPVKRTVGFLVVFILVISFVISLRATFAVNPGFKLAQSWAEDNLKKISKELPVIEIKSGQLIQPKSTYVLEIGKDFVFAVEPDRNKEEDLLSKHKNLFLITGKQLVFKQTGSDSRSEERRRDLAKGTNLKLYPIESGAGLDLEKSKISITPQTVAKWLKVISLLVFPGLLLILFCFYCIIKPLQVLFFSLFGLIANGILKAQVPYKQIFNISAYAVVPPTSLAVVLGLFLLNLPGFWFLFTAIYILYIFLGLYAVKTAQSSAAPSG